MDYYDIVLIYIIILYIPYVLYINRMDVCMQVVLFTILYCNYRQVALAVHVFNNILYLLQVAIHIIYLCSY